MAETLGAHLTMANEPNKNKRPADLGPRVKAHGIHFARLRKATTARAMRTATGISSEP